MKNALSLHGSENNFRQNSSQHLRLDKIIIV